MASRFEPCIQSFDSPVDVRIKALQLPWHGGCNPYVDILRESMYHAGFDFGRPYRVGRTTRIALLHWTENFWLQDTTSRAWSRSRRYAFRQALPTVLKQLRAQGMKVVWFAHNSTPHDWDGSADAWFRHARAFYEQIDAVAHLTKASSSLPIFDQFKHLPWTVVRHPHYSLVDPVVHAGKAAEITRLLMLGGASQPRKGSYTAAQAARGVPDTKVVITGDLGSGFASGFTSYPNVDLIDGILNEPELFALFDGVTAVLLNQPNQLNSGCMFLGLSRGAPVICPDTPANRETRSLVGREWLRLYEPPLSSKKLAQLIREPVPVNLPDLTPFRPELLGRDFRQWVDENLTPTTTRGGRR